MIIQELLVHFQIIRLLTPSPVRAQGMVVLSIKKF